MEEKQLTRRFSLDKDFMNFKTDDMLYSFMRTISTVKPGANNTYTEYLTLKKYTEEKKVFMNICGITAKTVNDHLKKLIESGLVKAEQMDGQLCYLFPQDYDGIYKIVSKSMISYLINTRNSQAIRIYLYLLNRSTFKEDYVFTVEEIKKGLGYAPTTLSANKVIIDVLTSFQKEGVIKYVEEWQEMVHANGSQTKTCRLVLKFIAKDIDQF